MKKSSLKVQMILSASVLCAVVLLSNIYILFISEQMQQITNERFSKERELHAFQQELHELQELQELHELQELQPEQPLPLPPLGLYFERIYGKDTPNIMTAMIPPNFATALLLALPLLDSSFSFCFIAFLASLSALSFLTY